jgi:subfamily B ATP-binding cassette protein MsbA
MINFLKQYIPYYKNYKRKFAYAFIGILLVSIGSAGSAYIIKPLLDEIFINKNETMLYTLPMIIVLLYTAKGIGRYIQGYYIAYIGQDIIRLIRDKLLNHILHLDLIFFNSKHSGELISRVTNDINRIQNAVAKQITRILQESITICALVGVIVYHSPMLAFYGLIVMPIAFYPLSLMAKKMKKISFKSQEKNSDLTEHLSETFNNIEIIKANSTEDLETKRFAQYNKSFFQINIKAVKINEIVSPFMEILGSIALGIVVIVGGKLVIDDEMTVGTFFSFLTALMMLYTPIKALSNLLNSFQDAIAANERVNDIFDLRANIISHNKPMPELCDTIEFQNVSLKFDDKIALNNISLKANKGETIALVGDSGGGKSSLINSLIRFYDISSGNININNQNIDNFSLKSLRDNISIVTQRVYIFNDTIGKNISYGQTYDKQKVIKALELSDAYDFVLDMPDGIDTLLDESGTNLSGGQRQRIAIARALYKNPQILILDEATSALDNQSESIITDLLKTISKDKITFVIAHRLSTIKNADKIAVFKDGNIISEGSQKELLNSCEEFKRLHNLANI